MNRTHSFNGITPCELRPTSAGQAGAKCLLSSVAIALALSGCSSAKVLSVDDVSRGPVARPAVVYVADFELAPGSVQSQSRTASLPIHAFLERSKAQSLTATMCSAIVKDLGEKGITAVRLAANSPCRNKVGWCAVFS
jgi:hypothetical protein